MANTGTFVPGANLRGGDAASFSQGVPDYGALNSILASPLLDAQYGIVANPGGGQANATQIIGRAAKVVTVASASDSVKLPQALAGTVVFVANAGDNLMQVFTFKNGETINGVNGYTTGFSQAFGKNALYFCPEDTYWYRLLSA